jgi:predicted alpha/beta-fold hydrolase
VPGIIGKAAAMSVPCDLTSTSHRLAEPANRIYMKRFLRLLRKKIRMKMAVMPGRLNDDGYERIENFKDFDDRYTAPVHGFENAEDYWKKASSKPLLRRISVPTLLIDAADDPFLTEACFPIDEAKDNPMLLLEIPDHGGHVGFVTFNRRGEYWSESRVVSFLNDYQ